MAGNNGIQLPISLQISNLQEVANQIKQFANKNVLADSLGGKKIDSELGKILSRLEQISAKAKTAFTTQADFSSVQKEVNQVELSLNKVQNTIKNLGFDELKIPEEFSGQIAALQGRIRELNSSLATFKGTQKEKLVSNVDFMADLQKADPKQAAKWLEKGYDELQKAIDEGMARVNTTLSLRAKEFQDSQKLITQNDHPGKIATTQLGALTFLQEAFKALPKDDKTRNTFQNEMAAFMKATENEQGKMEFSGFDKGAQGLNKFLKHLAESYSFTPEQMADIKNRLKQQVQELSREGQKITQTDVIKSMGHNEGLAKKILFGDGANDIEQAAKKYASDIKDAQRALEDKAKLEGQSEAFARVKVAFDIPNQEIKQKAEEIAAALKVPQEALQGFEMSILSAATKSPELAALFQRAAGEVAALTSKVEEGKAKLQSIDNTINKMQGISNFINRYVGLYAIVRKVTQAVRNAFNNIKELDKTITSIAVVTNMSQQDLWGKIGEYTEMAQQYGVATKDVYSVSQIFYQQGLQTSQVMEMTTESLKMAKIAGIDYTTAANAMTVAVRAFKLEMSEAQQVTDTYSALAAKFAVSSAEIANAMEKTASSAASVGMSVQSTSAFISVMEQTTRESAQNIGSALKSIISRYGEMKASPAKLLNVEGEEVAFNKVDTALKSIGISIKDASGQFRDFDDVIMELASKWDSLDNNTQRYIATIMAGNRQQSRFIALVSNYDELNRAMNVANNAENASIVQVAKTMDSLESKTNQLKNAFSQLYLELHIEDALKGAYEWLTRIIKTIGKLGTLKGVLPTLTNIIGFGAGAKNLVRMGMNAMQAQKSKYQVETTKAEQDIERIRAKASEDINARYKIQADLSELEIQKTQLESQFATMGQNLATVINANTPFNSAKLTADDLIKAQEKGQFSDANGIKNYLAFRGVDVNSDSGKALRVLLGNFESLGSEAQTLENTLKNLRGAIDEATGSKQEETGSSREIAAANRDVVDSAHAVAEGNRDAADGAHQAAEGSRDAAEGGHAAAESGHQVAETDQTKVQTGQQVAITNAQQEQTGHGAANSQQQLEDSARKAAHELNNIKGDQKLKEKGQNNNVGKIMTGVSLVSSAARMLGTFVLANGASHQDKSIDNRETSKILTGLGNGLSGLGTGAQMGMMAGNLAGHPIIGAVIGGLGGFLISGLGAIIDGVTMTLKEKLALQKEELQNAQDESLKKQAKSTDLSSQLDNLKVLKKNMYNSTEDMQAYKDAMNTMADAYPQLISSYDEAGNAIIDLNEAEQTLAELRLEGARAARTASIKEGELHQGYKKALDEALKVVETSQGHTYEVSASGVNYDAQSSSKTAFNLMTSDRQMKTLLGRDLITKVEGEDVEFENIHYEDALREAAEKLGKDLDHISFEELGDILSQLADETSGFAMSLSENILDWNGTGKGHISAQQWSNYKNQYYDVGSAGFVYKDLSALDKVISDYSDLFGGVKTARQLIGIEDENTEVTVDQMLKIQEEVNRAIARNDATLETINKSSEFAVSQSELFDTAITNPLLQSSDKTRLESNQVYSRLFNKILEQQVPSNYENILQWKNTDQAGFSSVATEASTKFIEWYNGLSDAIKTKIESMDFTSYLGANDIITSLGLDNQTPEMIEAFSKQFVESNQANRDRILKTIYMTGSNEQLFNGELNTDLTGLIKLNELREDIDLDSGEAIEYDANAAIDIAELFDNNQIISKYADYFTTQLLAINDLAEDGYVELAGTRLTALNTLAQQISTMPSEMQNELFGIVTNIDFSSFDAIKNAKKSLLSYGKKNNQVETIQPLIDGLDEAASKLVFNVNTLAAELTEKVVSAAKNIDTLISNAKSGLGLDKALEALESINARSQDTQFNFDELFRYDAALGKYVYTQKGLQTAIQQEEESLKENADKLQATQHTEGRMATFASIWQGNAEGRAVKFGDTQISQKYSTSEGLMATIKKQAGYNSDYAEEYETMAADFLKDDEIQSKTWENFLKYVQSRAANDSKLAEQAQQQYDAYEANKIHQFYGAIDWSKLATGTDFTGTNKELQKSLIEEINKRREESGKELLDLQADWETTLNAYLDETYDTDEAKTAAKTAINGQIKHAQSQQISTAISELLQGAGAAVSEGTAAILQEQGKLDLIDENGLLKSGEDFVQSALEIFNTTKDKFTTLGGKNKAYTEVLNAEFAKANAGKNLLSSGNTLDLNTIESSFTALGLDFETLYTKDENGKYGWNEGFENVLTTDIFGQTKITDWNEFVRILAEHEVNLANASQEEVNRWRRAYIDGVISDQDADDIGKTAAQTISTLASAKVGTRVNVQALKDSGELSQELLQKLDENGDGIFEVVSEYERDSLVMAIDVASIQDEEYKRQIQDAQKNIIKKRNQFSTLNGITSERVGEDAAKAFVESIGFDGTEENITQQMGLMDYVYDSFTNEWVATEKTVQDIQDRLDFLKNNNDGQDHTQEINQLQARLNDLQDLFGGKKKRDAISGLLQNYSDVSNEAIAVFETEFKDIDVDKYITEVNGKKTLDVGALREALIEAGEDIDGAFAETMASVIDDHLSYISNATDLTVSGTTSQADMANFMTKYNKAMGTTLKSGELFGYDEILKAFTLKPEYIQAYVENQKKELIGLGWSPEDIDKYIKDQTAAQFKSAVDINAFLTAENRKKGSQSYKTIASTMLNARMAETSFESEQASSYLKKTEMLSEREELNAEKFAQKKAAAAKAHNEALKASIEEEVNNDIEALEAGGFLAIEVMKKYSETGELTAEQVESAYKAKFNNLLNAMDSLEGLQVNNVVDSSIRDILNKVTGFLVSADGVILQVGNMVEAYEAIYKEMANTAGTTTNELNAAYARVLNAQDQQNIDTLDALENASGMTYDALGELLGKYGQRLDEFMTKQNSGIERTKFGKIKIVDWKAFADSVGLSDVDMNTPEYMEAYSSWVDSRVDFENKEKQRVDDAVEELKGLTEGKAGESFNISHLEAALGDSVNLSAIAQKYGAVLNQGLLTLGSNVDISGLINEISAEAEKAGKMIPEQLAELADAVEEMLAKITSLIKGGISGSLNNTDAVSLQNWASQNGIGQLDFTKTADGLRLSEQSAIALYNALNKVDKIQASLVFDELRKSLEETNDNFKDSQALMTHIQKIREGTYAADDKVSKARLEQYQAELDIAEKILATRSTTEDDSFKFMDKDIPAGQNNPLNYMESWQKAYEAMKATKKGGKDSKGLMEYTDFYNIITEMGNIAELSGQAITLGKKTVSNATEASSLITEAASKLKVTADGKMKVDLSKIGVDFATGADKMSKDVDAGIDALAQTQIDMLDSMIKLLEVVVAMEQLGDIDINGDNHLNLDEIFVIEGDGKIQKLDGLEQFTEDFKTASKKILDLATTDEDLDAALKAVKVNGYTMETIFKDATSGAKHLNIDAKAYQAALDSFYQMALSDDYDLDNVAASIQNIFSKTNLKDISIDVGTKTFYLDGDFKYMIDWDNKEAINAAVKAINTQGFDFLTNLDLSKDGNVRKAIEKLVKKRKSDKISVEDKSNIDYVLGLASGDIKINDKAEKTGANKGKFTGTYKGATFVGATKADVETKIKQALEYENQGFKFNVKTDGSVEGILTIGSAKIKVKQDSEGNDTYTAVSSSGKSQDGFKTLEAAENWLVQQGDGSKGTHIINGKTYNVFVDATTGITYTLMPDNTYMCEGHKFDSWEKLQNYFAYKDITKGGEVVRSNETKEVTVTGKARATYNFTKGKTTFEYEGPDGKYHKFASQQDYEQYLQAYEFSGGHVNNDTGNIQYDINGIAVEVAINEKGHLIYSFELPNGGGTVTSGTEEGIKQAIADVPYLTGGTATPTKEEAKKGVTYTVNKGNATIEVTYGSNGVTVKNSKTGKTDTDLETKLNTALQEKVDAETPTATATKAEVDLSTAEIKVTLPETINVDDEVPIKAATVTATLKDGSTPDVKGIVDDITKTVSSESITAALSGVTVTLAEGIIPTVEDVVQKIITAIQNGLKTIEIDPTVTPSSTGGGENSGNSGSSNASITGIVAGFQEELSSLNLAQPVKEMQEALNSLNVTKGSTDIQGKLDKLSGTQAATQIQNPIDQVNGATAANKINAALSGIDVSPIGRIQTALNSLKVSASSASATASVKVSVSSDAKGNMGAFAKGNTAMASGTRTLMGELGPELVVSNGRYFLAGQNGAEFVNLAKDAIVFNHQQTERLLAQGGIGSRGIPFTNERNAISYAKGNVDGPARGGGTASLTSLSATGKDVSKPASDTFRWTVAELSMGASEAKGSMGPAMASASAALAALKQLKAMWQSLQNATAKDLAGLGGSNGGGGGKNSDNTFLKTLEKWYNWLQEIAKQEEKINYQEKLRAKLASDNIKNGKSYYQSQKKSLEAFKSELSTTRDLMTSQQVYFDNRRDYLNKNNGPFSSLYEFDESGQLKYKKDKKYTINGGKAMTGYDFLSKLAGRREDGKANYDVKKQYEILVANGFTDYMKYDSSGKAIEYNKSGKPKDAAAYEAAVQAFWDKIDADKEEMQSLHDSINEYSDKALELQQAQNELLQEMQDNQMDLENEILDAVIEGRQREIDKLSDLKDAYSDASSKMISGLNEALNKEQEKYSKNQEDAELLQLRRRLAMLQRSGGSASEIASLQEQIRNKSQDAYFNEQQRQIDELQKAADEQIERMDIQIDILNQTLDYQKKNGLLWTDVYEVMKQSPRAIADFLQKNTEDYWGKSALAQSETADDWFFKAEQWAEFREDNDAMMKQLKKQGREPSTQDVSDFNNAIKKTYGNNAWNMLSNNQKTALEKSFKEAYAETGDFKAATDAAIQQNQKGLSRASSYQKKMKTVSAKFGSNWSDEIEARAAAAYVHSGEAGLSEALAKEKLWTTVKDSKGNYSVVENKDSSKKSMTKAGAQRAADRANDLNTFLKKYDPLLKKLTAERLKTVKQKYTDAYTSAYSGGRAAAKEAAEAAAKAYKPFKNALSQQKWAAYQKDADSSWSMRELTNAELTSKKGLRGKTPSNNTIGTYDEVYAAVAANKKKYKDWIKAKETNPKAARPKYNTKYKYDVGGMVPETGYALLHAKEGVFTAEQTDIIRNDLLGRQNNSLLNLLLDFKKAYNNIGSQAITAEPSIIIENASVNMNIDEIANDYDARRAGEQALSEMLKIARKTGAASTLRR